MKPPYRTGLGFDNHRLVSGRRLVVGGVEIPGALGTEAHSDGDVLVHALCDALYGAVGNGDIGEHFPNTDPTWKDRESRVFLEHACRLVREAGYRIVNVDATVFLESVKLSPYKKSIAKSLLDIVAPFWESPGAVAEDAISVKAKTMERCDAVGRDEAVAAQVAVLLQLHPTHPAD